ncbi:PIN domain-containing protein [Bdellovibrio sp. NC01]|uniref:PIN domain-containing protein n=1 Tax=Bdellovibrio sp. NC01 TaxID=2220073 RepID=UPI00115A7D68|nr:PIN domain-containing protein [Bdellovibrio sp. NC01]QDK37203.1 hypothetical protein DOE51_06170 [Bdellovibrio sp. NC01]
MAKKDHLLSIGERLEIDIDAFGEKLVKHISMCKIRYRGSLSSHGIAVIAPEYCWERNDPDDQLIEMGLLKTFKSWWEIYALLFADAGDSLTRELEALRKSWETWIQRTHWFDIPTTAEEARENLSITFDTTKRLLKALRKTGTSLVVLIIDTNSLLICPDVQAYRQCVEETKFAVVIPSTVLGELDELKVFGKSPAVQNRARKAISRLKGYRTQGSLVEGVTIDKTISLKTLSAEPDFSKTLQVLDRANKDDRIIAMTLQVQRENPSQVVVVVTSDINLQTKCAAIKIPFVEPPENIDAMVEVEHIC